MNIHILWSKRYSYYLTEININSLDKRIELL